jgi:hypothetical protein
VSEPDDRPWEERLRLARSRTLARGIEIEWERLGVGEEERAATAELAKRLEPQP